MNRDDLLTRLKAEADFFTSEGVRHVSLFGSQARGDARPDSDIDLLVEYQEDKRVSLFDLCHMEAELTERFGRPVQVLKAPIRKERLRADVEADAIRVL